MSLITVDHQAVFPLFSSGKTILIELVVFVFLGLIFFLFFRKKKRKPEIKEPEKKELPVIDPGDYFEFSENLFRSCKNKALKIRVITGKDKDVVIFASSLPHYCDKREEGKILLTTPQLIEITCTSTHELRVRKSPAVYLPDIQDSILRFLFTDLYSKYSWLEEAQSVLVDNGGIDTLRFKLSTETFFHSQLLQALSEIPGVTTASNFIGNNKRRNNYTFFLSNNSLYPWDELLLQIKEILNNYFKTGITININLKQEDKK